LRAARTDETRKWDVGTSGDVEGNVFLIVETPTENPSGHGTLHADY
jgi:hypothetical protein